MHRKANGDVLGNLGQMKIRNRNQLDYCPFCGEKTDKREVPVPGKEKTNLWVKCPEHGELLL